MPAVSFELDTFPLAASAARAANVSEDAVLAGLLRLMEWCWRATKVDSRAGEVPRCVLPGFFPNALAVTEACEAFGIFQSLSATHVVFSDAARHIRVNRAQSEAGRANASNLRKGTALTNATAPAQATPPAKRQAGSSSAQASPAGPRLSPGSPGANPEGDPEDSSRLPPGSHRIDQLSPLSNNRERSLPTLKTVSLSWENFESTRNRALGDQFAPDTQPGSKKWAAHLEALSRYHPALVLSAYEGFCSDPHWRERGLPWNAFMKQHQNYVQSAKRWQHAVPKALANVDAKQTHPALEHPALKRIIEAGGGYVVTQLVTQATVTTEGGRLRAVFTDRYAAEWFSSNDWLASAPIDCVSAG